MPGRKHSYYKNRSSRTARRELLKPMYYILDDNNDTLPTDSVTWSKWLSDGERRTVRQETIGNVFLSTVFLGMDQSFGSGGKLLLFESMTFGVGVRTELPSVLSFTERCSTWDEAVAQHERIATELANIQLLRASNIAPSTETLAKLKKFALGKNAGREEDVERKPDRIRLIDI